MRYTYITVKNYEAQGPLWVREITWRSKLVKLPDNTWVNRGNTIISTTVHQSRCKIDCDCRRPDISEYSPLWCITVPQHPHSLRDCDAKLHVRLLGVAEAIGESHIDAPSPAKFMCQYLLWTSWQTPATMVWFKSLLGASSSY